MLEIRDRRAAMFAAVLAVLGVTSMFLGLRVEPAALPPVAAAAPAQPTASTAPSRPGTPPAGTPPGTGAPAAGDNRAEALTPPRPASTKAPARSGMKRSEPVRLEIPAIDLDTEVTPVGLQKDGTIEVPPLRAAAPAGWYRHSPTPGETGATVIIGHVDSAREGPAVFHRLRELKPGDPLSVRRADRTVARFEVSLVASYPKHAFPTAEVYGPVPQAEVRLVTCGGSFDRSRGSYRDNVVVYGRVLR